MNPSQLSSLLAQVRSGEVDVAAALHQLLDALRAQPFEDLGFARVDHHRAVRQGFPEVVLGLGKTPAQIAINWLISQPNTVGLVKSTNPKHLEENLGALGWQLSEADIEYLGRSFPRGETINA